MSLQDLSGQDRLRCFSSTLDRHTHTARKRVPVCHIAHDNLWAMPRILCPRLSVFPANNICRVKKHRGAQKRRKFLTKELSRPLDCWSCSDAASFQRTPQVCDVCQAKDLQHHKTSTRCDIGKSSIVSMVPVKTQSKMSNGSRERASIANPQEAGEHFPCCLSKMIKWSSFFSRASCSLRENTGACKRSMVMRILPCRWEQVT